MARKSCLLPRTVLKTKHIWKVNYSVQIRPALFAGTCLDFANTNLIDNRRMFNVEIDDFEDKPDIPHKSLLQWICHQLSCMMN